MAWTGRGSDQKVNEAVIKRLQIGVLAVVVATLVAQPFAGLGRKSPMTWRFTAKASSSGRRRGRPRKFNRPSRAVTLTLPDDVVAALQAIDGDLSRAIVRAVQPLVSDGPRPAAELTTFGDKAVIVVPPNRTLRELTGVELVPLSDGRALISFDDRLSIPEIELRLRDALADPAFERDDRVVFEALADILSTARRAEGVSLRSRSIIVLYGVGPDAGHAEGGPDSPAVSA